MPIYEYRCNKCKTKFEFLVRNNQQSIICPQCNSKDIIKLFSVFGFISKGSTNNTTTSDSPCSSCTTKNCSTCSR